jgi:hypothetical protein
VRQRIVDYVENFVWILENTRIPKADDSTTMPFQPERARGVSMNLLFL